MTLETRFRAAAYAAAATVIVATNAYAECVPPAYETLVRGRFVRCESALLHTEAAGGNPAQLQRAYADEPGAEQQLRQGVVVIFVDRQVRIDRWTLERGSPVFQGDPVEVGEYVRYWWSGPAATAACGDMQEGESVDFLITQPCCDMRPAGEACLVQMRYAEPAPDALQAALSGLLGR